VHRDVKPDNIVLRPDGPVLVDFGIAKAIAAAGTNRLTRSGFTVGTSHYMSPEQVLGAADVDHRCDLYSLGCVLFECLAGRPPFWHHRDELVLHMQQVEPAPDVREFRAETPETLAATIARALNKEREQRWGTAQEMKEALAVGRWP
jgi:serine/threonine-protein kinase